MSGVAKGYSRDENGKLVFHDIHDKRSATKVATDLVNSLFYDIDYKTKRIEELKEELAKPSEQKIAELQKEVNDLKIQLTNQSMSSIASLTKEQAKKSQEWWKEHSKVCSRKGKYMQWIIVPTGIGTCIEYKCSHCGASIDLTDSENW